RRHDTPRAPRGRASSRNCEHEQHPGGFVRIIFELSCRLHQTTPPSTRDALWNRGSFLPVYRCRSRPQPLRYRGLAGSSLPTIRPDPRLLNVDTGCEATRLSWSFLQEDSGTMEAGVLQFDCRVCTNAIHINTINKLGLCT